MDSNVSKNTFSHKFFKLRFTNENTSIAVKNLLKQKLHSIFSLYLQSVDFAIDPQFFASALEPKIALLKPCIESITANVKIGKVLSTPQLTPIVYKCSIALALGSYFKIAPQIIAVNAIGLLKSEPNKIISESGFDLYVEITESGWINFYWDSLSLSSWLQQSFLFVNTQRSSERNLSMICPLNKTPTNLFSVQYVHARCCSLLYLAARKKLFVFQTDNSQTEIGRLLQPKSISWLDAQNNLWLKSTVEFQLIHQLLEMTDAFTNGSAKWNKLAINLSQTTAIFISECRFSGVTRHEYPPEAIARLGLIVLTQYWLQRILVEKLNVAAPTSL